MENLEDSRILIRTGAIRNAFVDLLAGTLGGIATVIVGQPLDTIKVITIARSG